MKSSLWPPSLSFQPISSTKSYTFGGLEKTEMLFLQPHWWGNWWGNQSTGLRPSTSYKHLRAGLSLPVKDIILHKLFHNVFQFLNTGKQGYGWRQSMHSLVDIYCPQSRSKQSWLLAVQGRKELVDPSHQVSHREWQEPRTLQKFLKTPWVRTII